MKPAEWYPVKLRKAYERWETFLDYHAKFTNMVLGGLLPPDSLAHEPEKGNDKLNCGVQGLGFVGKFEAPRLFS